MKIGAVCNHWTGLVDWTTGLTFDDKFSQKYMKIGAFFLNVKCATREPDGVN